MEKILSKKNIRVKQWKKLLTKKGRTFENAYLIEGNHLVEEAVKHQASVREYLVSEKVEKEQIEKLPSDQVVVISEEIAQSISDTPTNQGIFAVINIQKKQMPKKIEKPYLFLDSVQDPGNVGTMIRTADAAGFAGIVLGEGTADLYNSKVLRSAQGSHFHFPVFQDNLKEWITWFDEKKVPVYGTELNPQAVPINKISKQRSFGLIVGNEGKGMDKKLLKQTTKNIYIPILGKAESLNVAVAAGILMFALYDEESSK
ncbi:MAG: RNA methyltransferase [Pisciglobus halotolerans]|nr:RNA methyltransferase [Pisciglobus halotolerans]